MYLCAHVHACILGCHEQPPRPFHPHTHVHNRTHTRAQPYTHSSHSAHTRAQPYTHTCTTIHTHVHNHTHTALTVDRSDGRCLSKRQIVARSPRLSHPAGVLCVCVSVCLCACVSVCVTGSCRCVCVCVCVCVCMYMCSLSSFSFHAAILPECLRLLSSPANYLPSPDRAQAGPVMEIGS